MPLSPTADIAPEKIRDYLLRPRRENDKSAFFIQAGYQRDDWQRLAEDIRQQILPCDARLSRSSVYGDYHSVEGTLTGPSGAALDVTTIWLVEAGSGATRFITAFPSPRRTGS